MTTRRPRILCVDDEPANLNLLDALLTPHGYEVIKAVNGRKAIEKISEDNIDLVLMDVMMPELNGFDICKMIKEDDKFRHLPIILVTALRSSKDRIRGIEAGADDFISKPFDQGEILARIQMLIKVKDLNERLNSAYININNLISCGEEIMMKFDPIHFDLIPMLDSIVSINIRKTEDMIEKPETMLVGLPDKSEQWQWLKYQYLSDELRKNTLEYSFENNLTSQYQGKAKIEFINKADIGKSEISPFSTKLESDGLAVSNAVCYLSNELVILALNYGRDDRI